MICQSLKEKLSQIFPLQQSTEESDEETSSQKRMDGVIDADYSKCGYHLDIQASPEKLLEVVSEIDQAGFFIESITGVDWIKDDKLEAVYDFCRYDFELCRVVVRVFVPRQQAQIPTITDIYSGANWHERETHDFFGIKFEGHPHLIPLLLPEDADFHPLLKDFKA